MTYRYPHAAILIFARAPQKGKVKTRLIPALGEVGATALYKKLLQHTLTVVADSQLAPPVLCCRPDSQHPFFQSLAGRFQLYTQLGNDLGERMANALNQSLQSASLALLIGSDCPAIDARYLAQAFEALATRDVVLGPADDGGYVLVGMSGRVPCLFENIDWGSDRVLTQTRSTLEKENLSWIELESLPDIDTPDDLACLPDEIKDTRLKTQD